MKRIKVLDTFTANRIAAGEVVERPASIVKELVENAIDAGSTSVSVSISGGGIERIIVTDNGSGLNPEDMALAFERHATNKISSPHDLDAISTLGFRGEALCSIAAVAQVEMRSRQKGSDEGRMVRVAGGEILEEKPFGCPDGTSIEVAHLFYNTPARLRFLKKAAYEGAAIGDIMLRNILAYPDISFSYSTRNNSGAAIKTIYHSSGDGELLNALFCVYGKDTVETLRRVEFESDLNGENIRIDGYISRSDGAKNNRNYQSFFINGRYIQSPLLSRAIQEAFGTRLMGGRFPLCALHISMPFSFVDVNIHPHKLNVRFKDENAMSQRMRAAISQAIGERAAISWRAPPAKNEEPGFRSRMHTGTTKTNESVWEFRESTPEFEPPAEKADKQEAERIGLESPAEKNYDQEIDRIEINLPAEKAYEHETKQAPTTKASAEPKKRIEVESEYNNVPIPEFFIEKESGIKNGTLSVKEATQLDFACTDLVDNSEVPIRVIGQVFRTYVIVEQGDLLYFIDQHAAHERMLYDECVRDVKYSSSQQLLLPIELKLDPMQGAVLKENKTQIDEMGFGLTQGEDETLWSLNKLPQFFKEAEAGDFLLDVLEVLSNQEDASAASMKREEMAQFACKHAIRANDDLNEDEMRALISRFDELKEWHCPHGRPIVLRIDQKSLEKTFRRKM